MIAHLSLLALFALPPSQTGELVPSEHVTDIAVSEEFAGNVADDLSATLLRALSKQDWVRLEDAFAADFHGRFPMPEDARVVAEDGPRIVAWSPDEAAADLDRASMVAVLREHVGGWVAVDRAQCKLFRFLLEPAQAYAFGAAHLVLAGRLPGGARTELHAKIELGLTRDAEEPWRIRALRWVDGHQVTGTGGAFRDVTDLVGFHFNASADHVAYNLAAVDDRQVLTVGGVNALDWNRDGFWDLLATWREQMSVLFINDGRGGFRREPLPIDVPRDAGQAILFLDLDGDGAEELIGTQISGYADGQAWIDLFTRVDGVWQRRERALRFAFPDDVWGLNLQSIEPGDIDGDGDLDLFLCAHSDSRSRGADFNRFVSFDGSRNLLFLNEGDLSFREEATQRGLSGTQYTFVARFFDFDQDGDLDLFEGNDYGPNWLWRNDGSGNFERDDEHALSNESAYTMGFTFADVDNTGDWNVHLSNMYSHAGGRIVPLATSLGEDVRDRVAVISKGDQVFTKSRDTGGWREHGAALGVAESGWAWGSMFFDLENDGDKDLFVVNGYSSNSDEEAPDW